MKGTRLMFSFRRAAILALGAALLVSACGGGKPATETPGPGTPGRGAGSSADGAMSPPSGGAKVLNLYIWSDYLAPNTLSDFEKQTGIKVHVSYFDTNETLETRLLAGNSGFDIVVPTASYFERQIKAGVYLTLDKSKLPNLKNMDPQLMAKVALHDPDNAHGVIYTWGTNGIGYNEKMIKQLLPGGRLEDRQVRHQRAGLARGNDARGVELLGQGSELAAAQGFGRCGKHAAQDPALYPQHQFFRVHRSAGEWRSVRRRRLQRRCAAGSRSRPRRQ
jgi:ABC-type glycerol-3-phosphate transport system substrate-binding protein